MQRRKDAKIFDSLCVVAPWNLGVQNLLRLYHAIALCQRFVVIFTARSIQLDADASRADEHGFLFLFSSVCIRVHPRPINHAGTRFTASVTGWPSSLNDSTFSPSGASLGRSLRLSVSALM
jgi:hypothetical protein